MLNLLTWLERGFLNFSWWQLLIYALTVTHITIAGVTVFLHRCQAHRALDLHAIPSHFFRFWLWMTTGMVTKEWVSIHRKHHAKCETEQDPHSPQIKGIDEVLWRGAELYRLESKNQETVEKYSHGTPNDWIEKNLYSRYSAHGVAFMLVLNFFLFGLSGIAIWALQMAWIPFFAAGVINGIGHYWGYRNFDCADASRNISPWGILIGGEELHNNHHTYPTSAKLSNKWYEFDIGWLYIKLLSYLGLAKIKKIAPVAIRQKNAKPTCDLDTLHALIHYRYDAMDRYKKMLLKAYEQEAEKLRQRASELYHKAVDVRALLSKSHDQLNELEKKQLDDLLQHSKVMRVLYDMRNDLHSLWQKSGSSKEQLLEQLQAWCDKAEKSGLDKLADFSYLIRSYQLKSQ